MANLTCEDFEAMSIVELVEFIDKKSEKIREYEEELEKYFGKVKPETFVPFVYYDVFSGISSRKNFSPLGLYLDCIELENKEEALNMPDAFYELHWINKKEIERAREVNQLRDTFYKIYTFEGNMFFLEDLLEKGYFESGKANMILGRYVGTIHSSRYSKNDSVMSALAMFMKDKDESIQMFITELIVENVERSEAVEEILLYIYKDGLDYTKRGVMHVFLEMRSLLFHRIDNFDGAQRVLDVVAEDLEGQDLYLRNQIIQFIEFFDLVQDEISQYLLEEKGIVYTEDMKYEAFYDKTVDMAEVLKEEIDAKKEKEKDE